MCSKTCGLTPKEAKKHYLQVHGLSVGLSLVPEKATRSRQRVEGTHSPVVDYFSDDDDDPMDRSSEGDGGSADADRPSLTASPLGAGAGRGSPGSRSYKEDEWEEGSTGSDTSSEAMLCEDDDDVVPCSFSLTGPLNPSSNDDPLEFEGQLPEPSLELKEADPPLSEGVYGSDSERLPAVSATLC